MINRTNDRGVASIGAMELKARYQKNFLIAEGMALLTVAITLLSLSLAGGGAKQPVPERDFRGFTIDSLAKILNPPSVEEEKKTPAGGEIFDLSNYGPVEVVDDTTPIEDVTLPTKNDLAVVNSNPFGDDAGAGPGYQTGSGGSEEETYDREIFIASQVEPKLVKVVKPKYPPMARRIGLEGTVEIQVVIDTLGRVINAVVLSPLEDPAGFGEAALEAAWKSKWSPALQNGRPVKVPVSYSVDFRL